MLTTFSKLTPMEGRIVLEFAPASRFKRMDSGVITISAANANQQISKVLAVGPGRTRKDGTTQPVDFKVGDRALFNKESAVVVVVEDVKYFIIEGTDVFATVRDPQEWVNHEWKRQVQLIEQLLDLGCTQITVTPEQISLLQGSPLLFEPAADCDAERDTQHAWLAGKVTLDVNDTRWIELYCLNK